MLFLNMQLAAGSGIALNIKGKDKIAEDDVAVKVPDILGGWHSIG